MILCSMCGRTRIALSWCIFLLLLPHFPSVPHQHLQRWLSVNDSSFAWPSSLKFALQFFSRNSVLPNHEARSHGLPANSTFCVVSLRNRAFSSANPNQPSKASIVTAMFLFQESV
ncbi:hypothetical protein I7I53_04914 [Histoplasma capsulatum var. duboisii H88]|uniref:Secreted protein n=1 Tax=Ajellomyces capsulatus (strain H88) TaxID=544711 RepID=A0A8A1LVS9_AJEC8|nr:hypothetical protein I7I53_04914 [Histoplasma capsulatum var. duboisii H88]